MFITFDTVLILIYNINKVMLNINKIIMMSLAHYNASEFHLHIKTCTFSFSILSPTRISKQN